MHGIHSFIPIAILTSALLDWTGLPQASAAPCPCTSNAPTVNTFPIRSLRSGRGRVLNQTAECKIPRKDRPHLAIAPVVDHDPAEPIRGYQLVVVDKDKKLRCAGTQLAGIVFDQLLVDDDDNARVEDEPIVIRQVAMAKVTPDRLKADQCFLHEARLVYMVAAAERPRDSLCAYGLKNSWLQRKYRKVFGYEVPKFPSPEISKGPSQPFEVYPSQLADYAVVIPNADYNDSGILQNVDSRGQPPRSLEWYELACASGALAHTDLNGLVEPGEKDAKDIRAAAMRMFRASYWSEQTDTINGIPISFRRDKKHSDEYEALCTKQHAPGDAAASGAGSQVRSAETSPKPAAAAATLADVCDERDNDKDIDPRCMEARWTANGAKCVSHSRLWMKDTVNFATVAATEKKFLDDLMKASTINGVSNIEIPCPASDHPKPKDPPVYFTSGVIHHIDHEGVPQSTTAAAVKAR